MDNITLLLTSSLIAMICAILWLLNALVFKNNIKPSYYWVIANIFVSLGFYLYTERSGGSYILGFYGSDFSIIIGLFFIKMGLDSFLKLNETKWNILFLCITLFAIWTLRFNELHYFCVLTIASYTVFVSFLLACRAYKSIKVKSLATKLAIAIPISITGWFQLLRIIGLIINPGLHTTNLGAEGVANNFVNMFVLLSIIGMNTTLAGVIIGYLTSQIKFLSTQDFLTKTYNRKYLYEFLNEQNELLKMGKGTYSLTLIDIDHFKRINDTYGHDVGDKVLINASKLFKSSILELEDAIVARLGGEEFCIVYPGFTKEKAMKKTEEIRAKLEEDSPSWKNTEYPITASFGVSECVTVNSKTDTFSEVLKKADEAMYEAKNSGRNSVIYK